MNSQKNSVTLILISFILVLMTTTNLHANVLKPHLYKEKLDNGLTVLVKETPGVKVATVQIWVKAGSIYEGPDEGGITHLIEHMIFKGTETRGAGEVAAAIEEKGGQINAYTSFEYTVYHATLSSRYWGTAMEVLSDAVQHSIFDKDELEREKLVVLEELRMRNDRPPIMMYQALMTNSYAKHPYRLPVIGSVESVSSFTREDIINYMAQHYHPDNFTVVVVGDVRANAVVGKVKELFGGLAFQQSTEPELVSEPPRKEARLFTVEAEVNQPQMAIAFPSTSFNDPDTPIIDVISGILGSGETSRLYNQLRNEMGLVYHISASSFTPKYKGLFEVTAVLESSKIAAAMEAALSEIFKMKYLQVEEDELARVKRSLESDFVFALERVEGQARVIGSFNALTGDPREDDYLERVRAVTAEDIIRVSKKYFNGHQMIAGSLVSPGVDTGLSPEELVNIAKRAEVAAKNSIPTSLVTDSYLPNTYRFRLANGIKLIVRENSQIPTVAIRAVFPGGLRGEAPDTNGAFAFIGDLLPKSTTSLNSRELSLQIADMAGDISGFNGKNTFGLKASFLSRFFKEGMVLVKDVLLNPAFDPVEAEKIRPERLAVLKQQEDSLPSLAFKEFNRILFQGHPYGLNTMGSEEALKSLSAEDLHRLYNSFARPEKLVLTVVGDVKAEEVYEEVNNLFGEWQANKENVLTEEDFLAPEPPAEPTLFNISRDKEQVHIIIGFMGTTIKSPDRYALEILETVLSGQSGRLFRQLRDKQSLAYSLSAFSLLGLDTGSFGIYIGTSPDKKDEAIKSLWQELYRIRETGISVEELNKAKNILVGAYELGLQTHGSQAMDMALTETYDLGLDFGNKYVHEISQVKIDDVMDAARKYIQDDHYVLVTVGSDLGHL